jgi:Ca-activated chloride channel homolog
MGCKIILSISIFFSLNVQGQEEKLLLRSGNKKYANGDFSGAQNDYQKSMNKNSAYAKADFNMGNSFQRQGDIAIQAAKGKDQESQKKALEEIKKVNAEAVKYYTSVATKTENKIEKAKAFHNIGNAQLKSGELEKSIEAYENSLRNNPLDEETRYNLAYAKKMLQKQQQDKKEDKKDEKKEDQQKKNEPKPDEPKDKKEEQQPQDGEPKPNEVSKNDAKNMLDALNKNEKDLQNKLKKKKLKGTKVKTDKDW